VKTLWFVGLSMQSSTIVDGILATLLNGLNIKIMWVLTLFKIFKPFVFKIFFTFSLIDVMGKLERVWVTKVV
jgi:hypothetical protein